MSVFLNRKYDEMMFDAFVDNTFLAILVFSVNLRSVNQLNENSSNVCRCSEWKAGPVEVNIKRLEGVLGILPCHPFTQISLESVIEMIVNIQYK